MKHLLLSFSVLFSFLVGEAWADSRGDRIIDGLLSAGSRVLQVEQERRAAARRSAEEAEPSAEAEQAPATEVEQGQVAEEEPATEGRRRWRDRGRGMLNRVREATAERLGDRSISEVISSTLKEALDRFLAEYKEQYKQEGREYAREVGDIIVNRVVESPKISGPLYSLQLMCWGIILYLTLVTVIVLICLLYLKRANRKLMASVQELKELLKESKKSA